MYSGEGQKLWIVDFYVGIKLRKKKLLTVPMY